MNLIFDFDGTIVDSLHMTMRAYNKVASSYGCHVVDESDLDSYRDQNAAQILKRLHIPIHLLGTIAARVRKEMKEQLRTVPLIEGMKECLETLSKQGHDLSIVTSNAAESVRNTLGYHQLLDLFSYVHSSLNLFGKHRVLNAFLRRHHIPHAKAVYFGDETRDVVAAKKTGIAVVAVCWGLNTEKALAEEKPSGLAHHPSEILTLMERLAH